MALTVSEPKGGSDYVLPPAGSHLARCYRVIDLGTQKVKWQGVEKAQKKVMIVWELHGEDADGKPLIMDDGRPLVISKRFTPSLSAKATLRAFLVAWRGRQFTDEELSGFHLKNILDKWCMLNLTQDVGTDGKTYCNISSIGGVPSAIKKAGLPEGVNPTVWFDIDEPDMEVFDAFPDYLKKIITETPEWKMREIGGGINAIPDEPENDAPF